MSKMMRKTKLALLTSMVVGGLSLTSTSVNAESFVVNDIKVQGLNRVSLGAVLLALPVKQGDLITEDTTALAMKRLYQTGNFDDVTLSRRNNDIIITVKERPTIGKVDFAGNSQIESTALKDVIERQGLKAGEALNIQTLNEIKRSLEDFYHSAGMYQASVKPVLTYLPRNRVDVKLEFTEGVSAKIEQINIVGNKAFDEDVLLAQMQLRDEEPWWNFFASRKYDAQKFGADLESLRSYYQNRGYVNFDIKNTAVEVTPDKKSLYLTIGVSEGDKYSYGNVNLRGNTLKYDIDMKKLITLKKGEIYNASDVAKIEETLRDFLGKYGYANSKVKAYPSFNEDSKSVDLDFFVEPGARIYVAQIFVTGNTVTDDTVIRRELRQMDGTWLSNEAVDTSKTRLNRTGYFETVDIKTHKAGTATDTVNLETVVKEQPTGSISGGIGYGTNSGMMIQAGISQNNVFGWGTRATIQAYDNDYRQHIEVGYTDPYFTIDQISLGGRIYYDKFEGDQADVIAYNNDTIGAELSTGYPVSEKIYLRYSLGFENTKIKNAGRPFLQGMYFWQHYADDSGLLQGTFNNYTSSFTFTRNNLDKTVFPTDGSKQVATIYATLPTSDLQYYKLSAETHHYFPLDNEHDFVIGLRGRVAYGDGYGKMDQTNANHTLPYFENFYLGGTEWLRGFRHNAIGPKAVYYGSGSEKYFSDENAGGNALWATSLELFIPTPFVAEAYKRQVRTSLFMDAGALWDTKSSEYNSGLQFPTASDYAVSAGVSLTWLSPIGPLVFSFAKAIKQNDGDETEAFNFNIGGQF